MELYPDLGEEKTLKQVIVELNPLTEFGEIDENDIYHSFRVYPEHMRAWISDIKEGESAFDNVDDCKKPHQVKDGKIVINQQKNGDKYKRQYWNKVGPCIHTRNMTAGKAGIYGRINCKEFCDIVRAEARRKI